MRAWRRDLWRNWELYLFMLLPVAFVVVFNYLPLYGAQVAFRHFVASKGIMGSPWVGLENFAKFFKAHGSINVILNTVSISVYNLLVSFPIPIIFAVMLNYCGNLRFRRFSQMVTYAPHFISVVVMCGMIIQFTAPRTGIINILRTLVSLGEVNYMGNPDWFSSMYVWTGVWQGMGWGSIIYISALAGVNPELHESATIDGASILARILHVDLPSIMPVISIQLILSAGSILNVGYEKVLLLQNALNGRKSEVIQTLVYKTGIAPVAPGIPDISYSSAIGLMLSLVNVAILLLVNTIVRKTSENSLL